MKIVKISVDEITDWRTFHSVFARVLGFPKFYGQNMDAWIDCMTSIDDPDAGMSAIMVDQGEFLVLDLGECTDFAKRCPIQFEAIQDATAFVNYRRMELGELPILGLAFYK